jgi:hypothetical protein
MVACQNWFAGDHPIFLYFKTETEEQEPVPVAYLGKTAFLKAGFFFNASSVAKFFT